MEVHVDDMIIKSRAAEHYIADLKETFAILWCFHMKLNFNKCAFKVTSSKFLDFIVSQHGIQANPKKIRAL